MLPFALLAQLVVASPPPDSTYATAALRSLVERASAENRFPPSALRSYRSHVETELSLLIRDTLGREQSAEVEQLAAHATWTRGDRYDLHVVGYRAQNVGVPYSTLSLVRAWTVPTLYGERLSLGTYFSRTRQRGDTLVAVHPFAADRDRFYRFDGGDTVATLRSGSRTISVARIRVRPNLQGNTRLAAFDGEIDLDAQRGHIIRMRGQFVVIGGARTRRQSIAQRTGIVAAAYVEFVNAEIDEAYWLPTFQRTEFQASFPILGQTRPIFRLVSSITGIAVNDTSAVATDSSDARRVTLSWAPSDTLNAFHDWRHEIGAMSGSVHADDFDDVAPDAWRMDGPPRLDLFPSRMSRILRFNRVEGLFTGIAPSVNFRSAVPGLTAGVFGGWAWTEQTVRGGAATSYRVAHNIYGFRAERSLASTNDFAPTLADDPGFAALIGSVDDYDYVDRRSAALSATHVFGSVSTALASVEVGVDDDRPEQARLTQGAFASGTRFRPNRGVERGASLRAGADIEIHPGVSSDFVQPGVGARLRYEIARGDLDWSRVEARLAARRYFGAISTAAEAQGGIVFASRPPPQRLFELGGIETLPGYDYKQFAGDRAALFRVFASYRSSLWRRPHRFWRNYMLPGVSPGLAVSAQGGWAELSSVGALAAARALIPESTVRAPTGTDGARATVGAGVTVFSDMVHIGLARPVDRRAPLRLVAGFGAAF